MSTSRLEKQWEIAQKSLITLAQKCQEFAPDGLTLYLPTIPLTKYEQANHETLVKLFQDSYAIEKVNLYDALNAAIAQHFWQKEHGTIKRNGSLILVILDSDPGTRRNLINLLVKTTQKIDNAQEIGILFAQVGDNFITKGFLQALDDDLALAGAKFDIIDTRELVTISVQETEEFLLNALFD